MLVLDNDFFFHSRHTHSIEAHIAFFSPHTRIAHTHALCMKWSPYMRNACACLCVSVCVCVRVVHNVLLAYCLFYFVCLSVPRVCIFIYIYDRECITFFYYFVFFACWLCLLLRCWVCSNVRCRCMYANASVWLPEKKALEMIHMREWARICMCKMRDVAIKRSHIIFFSIICYGEQKKNCSP